MSDISVTEGARVRHTPALPGMVDATAPARARAASAGHALQWAVGGFLFLVGGAMLVAPHDYAAVWRVLIIPYSAGWGGIYLLGGLALLAAPMLDPGPWFSTAAYLLGAALLLVLSGADAAVGRLIGVAGNLPLAAACLAAIALSRRSKQVPPDAVWGVQDLPGHLIRSALGTCGALAGLVMLAAPSLSADPVFDPLRPLLPWSGLVLVLAGSGLAALPVVPLLPATRATLVKLVSLIAGSMCLLYVLIAIVQAGNWPGIAYWGWLGLVMAGEQVLRAPHAVLVPGSLRSRLGFLLAAAAAIPLIVVVALVSDQMEGAARSEARTRQETEAVTLADSVHTYIDLHRAALDALAAQPGLAAMSRAAQLNAIKVFHDAFPDALSFAIYGPDGSPLARSEDGPAPQSLANTANYQAVRATGKPAMDIVLSAATQRPIFAFTAPIFDAGGHFAGLVSTALGSSRVADFLTGQSRGQGQIYLLSNTGRVLAHPDARLVAALADMSNTPLVSTVLAAPAPNGALSYTSDEGEQLIGYAHVPDLGWLLIVQQPANQVLASVRASREIVFGILLLSVAGTSVAGWWLAGRLAAPLTMLAGASAALAAGDADVPLPTTGIAEADHLARTFGAMRTALVERSARLRESEAELRATADRLSRANQEQQQTNFQLQALTRRLFEVQEEERRVLSRDLHDTAAQSLTALKIGLGQIERETACSPEQSEQIAVLRQTAEAVLEDLHRLAVNLRPSSLDRSGLVPALQQLTTAFNRQSEAQVTMLAEGMEGERLPGAVETALYRIVQESLTNIARYAQAGRVAIFVRRDGEQVTAVIEDDGVGFDVEDALSKGRLGLLGMRERAEMLGGTLTIESSIGGGSTVFAELPLLETGAN